MTDQPNDEADDTGDGPSLGDYLRDRHDRIHMEQEFWTREVNRFFDELTLDQVMLLRRLFSLDRESKLNAHFDGQLYQLIRLKHRVDPDTGRPWAVEDLLAQGGDDEKPAP